MKKKAWGFYEAVKLLQTSTRVREGKRVWWMRQGSKVAFLMKEDVAEAHGVDCGRALQVCETPERSSVIFEGTAVDDLISKIERAPWGNDMPLDLAQQLLVSCQNVRGDDGSVSWMIDGVPVAETQESGCDQIVVVWATSRFERTTFTGADAKNLIKKCA